MQRPSSLLTYLPACRLHIAYICYLKLYCDGVDRWITRENFRCAVYIWTIRIIKIECKSNKKKIFATSSTAFMKVCELCTIKTSPILIPKREKEPREEKINIYSIYMNIHRKTQLCERVFCFALHWIDWSAINKYTHRVDNIDWEISWYVKTIHYYSHSTTFAQKVYSVLLIQIHLVVVDFRYRNIHFL